VLPSTSNVQYSNAISIGKDLKLEGVEANDVVGIESEGTVNPKTFDRPVDVFSNAKIKNSKLGDIVGIKLGLGHKDDK
jgi:hypothetical protein